MWRVVVIRRWRRSRPLGSSTVRKRRKVCSWASGHERRGRPARRLVVHALRRRFASLAIEHGTGICELREPSGERLASDHRPLPGRQRQAPARSGRRGSSQRRTATTTAGSPPPRVVIARARRVSAAQACGELVALAV